MNIDKVLFIGLGGAGQRHLRILHSLLPEQTKFTCYRRTGSTPLLRPDFTVDENRSLEEKFQLTVFDSIESAFEDAPDLTVISTPTACHREPLLLALKAGSSVIVEKPWAENLDDFTLFSKGVQQKKLSFLISFQRRYHPLMLQAKQMLQLGTFGQPISAIFTVFSDVRTWHGYEDWRSLYAVRPDLGGGVLLTEIHETDLCYWFFGLPKAVFCSGGNRGVEVLEVEDTVQMILLYERFSVQLNLCFMHITKTRSFHIAAARGDIKWQEESNRLTVMSADGSKEEFSAPEFTNDTMFTNQAKEFISSWSSEKTNQSIDSAYASLAIVLAAKRSMLSGQAEPIDHSLLTK